jgi:replicative DNA helicase
MTTTTLSPTLVSVPQSREAEEAALGCVFINPHTLYELSPFLRSHHFYIHRHAWIWDAFLALDARRVPIDLLTVSDELDRQGKLGEVGGPAYLTSLVNQVPSSINAEHYGRIVAGHAARRAMLQAANRIAELAYDESKAVEECIGDAVAQTSNLEILNNSANFVNMGDLLSTVYDETQERAKDPKEVWGLATGLPKFDKKTGGLQLGELTYIAGSPGVGKTWLDLAWAMELGRQEPGALISLEMKRSSIGRRVLSGVTGVSTRAMKSGFMDSSDWQPLINAVQKYEGFPVWIDDSSYDSARLRATLTWLKREKGIRWFILDYALLMLDTGKDETEQSKIISANMKRIVHDLDIAGVVLHSVTKVGMDGEEPKQSDQRGSGQAIHDADVQLFLTKLYDKDPDLSNVSPEQKAKMATLWCSKGRELEESKFKLHLVRRGNSPFWGEWMKGY